MSMGVTAELPKPHPVKLVQHQKVPVYCYRKEVDTCGEKELYTGNRSRRQHIDPHLVRSFEC